MFFITYSHVYRILLFGLSLALVSCGTVFADAERPNEDLRPEDVVEIQLAALRTNGPDNEGIERTFRFASPANRAATGPLDRFASLFRTPAYRPMLDHVSAEVFSPVVDAGVALVPVTVSLPDGSEFDYMFVLSRQSEDPYENMWMTDAVQFQGTVVPVEPDPERTI
ncbi:MAG: DUF4864 domain-containing protein [Spirochaetota bacterium]